MKSKTLFKRLVPIFLSAILWSQQSVAEAFKYECWWDSKFIMKLLGSGSYFEFTVDTYNETLTLSGQNVIQRFTRSLTISVANGKVNFTFEDKIAGSKAWDYFLVGQPVEFTNGIDTFLTCSVSEIRPLK
jgi:hypothetical protein